MYNCTNIEEVIYKNMAPMFMEFGPYSYPEFVTGGFFDYATCTNTYTGV